MKKIKTTFLWIILSYILFIIGYFVYLHCIKDYRIDVIIDKLSPVTLVSGLITLYMTYVYQTSTRELQDSSTITSNCPKILVRNKFELISKKNNNTLLKIRIADENNKMLKKAKINDITISWSKDLFEEYTNEKSVYKGKEYQNLEYTPKTSDIFRNENEEQECYYYVIAEINCPVNEIRSTFFKLKIDLSVCTTNVEAKYIYTFLVNPDDNFGSGNVYRINHEYYYIESTSIIS